jgi:capsular exopolysaccharide synthesis family protein
MSRIHEALRRAGLEREAQSESEHEMPLAPMDTMADERPLRITAELSSKVPKHAWTPSIDAVPCMQQVGPVVEQFRRLRSQMKDARHEHGLKTILVTSGLPGEGKSFVAVNLAVSLIRHSMNRVLLIDADLRRPTLHKTLGTSSEPGLSEYLAGERELHEVLQQTESSGMANDSMDKAISNLTFLPAGKPCENSAELLANGRLQSLIASVAQSFDWILIDSPPILTITDASEIARCTDAVLLVARHGVTPFDVLQRAQAALQKYRILGVVLNASTNLPNEDGYYGYYGDVELKGQPEKRKQGIV